MTSRGPGRRGQTAERDLPPELEGRGSCGATPVTSAFGREGWRTVFPPTAALTACRSPASSEREQVHDLEPPVEGV